MKGVRLESLTYGNMDQVRKIIGWLKQHHFWVLSVLVVLISLFCWWRASGAMSKQFKENESKISSAVQQVQTVQSKPFHPNDGIKTEQTKEIVKLSDAVATLWQQLYDVQRETVLKWPSGPGELLPEFVKTVEKLKFGDEIEDRWREHYQNYIYNHFKELPKIVGARAIEEGAAGATGGQNFSRLGRSFAAEPGAAMTTGAGTEDDNDYICEWADQDQAAVRADLEFSRTPSSLRIWYTQENLWVYRTLLDVIKNTNDAAHATRMSNAAVRGIYSLQVGRAAAPFSRQPNRILKFATAAPAGEVPGGESPSMGSDGPGSEFSPPGGAEFSFTGPGDGATGVEMTEEQERGQLLHGRYLGEDGKPMPYGAGGGATAEPGTEPVDIPAGPLDLSVFGKEYKRLPVRMVLEMDQRHLPKLIAECADMPLQIEVQEVRVNTTDLMGGGGGAMPGATSFSERGGPGGASLGLTRDAGLQQFNPHPEIVTVGIQGVIYIFKEPDKELLKPPGEESDVEDPNQLTQVQP